MEIKRLQKIISLFFILFITGQSVLAQDIHFSQNYATPLYVNPALTGLYNGDFRVTAAYRSQWNAVSNGAPYRTMTASFDGKIVSGATTQSDWLSGGLMIYTDKAGFIGFTTNTVDLSLAYNKALNNQDFISFGVMGGLSLKSIDLSGGEFGTQFDGINYDAMISSGEDINDERYAHANVSTGVVYYHIRDARDYFFVGGGAYNILKSEKTFLGNNFNNGASVPLRLSLQAGGSIKLNHILDIVPSIYFMNQAKSMKTDVGIMGRYVLQHNDHSNVFRAFSIGPLLRVTQHFEKAIGLDALIVAAKVDYDDLSIGLSYDLNISELNNATSGKGGSEVSVVYTPKVRSKRASPVSCPRF